MKSVVNRLQIKLGTWVSSIALLMAIKSTSNTCMFMTYQPDLPKELQ